MGCQACSFGRLVCALGLAAESKPPAVLACSLCRICILRLLYLQLFGNFKAGIISFCVASVAMAVVLGPRYAEGTTSPRLHSANLFLSHSYLNTALLSSSPGSLPCSLILSFC